MFENFSAFWGEKVCVGGGGGGVGGGRGGLNKVGYAAKMLDKKAVAISKT